MQEMLVEEVTKELSDAIPSSLRQMYGPKSTGIAKWAGQVSFDSRGKIGDVGIEFGQRLDFAHVAPQVIELAKALYRKRFTSGCSVHPEAILTIFGNEFNK